MHLNLRNIERRKREKISQKFFIPGYEEEERTVARKPSFTPSSSRRIAFHVSMTPRDPNEPTPDESAWPEEISESVERSSISSFLDSSSLIN